MNTKSILLAYATRFGSTHEVADHGRLTAPSRASSRYSAHAGGQVA